MAISTTAIRRQNRSGTMLLVVALLFLGACATPLRDQEEGVESRRQADGPYVYVLGTAQDGGLPQIGCRKACCQRAHQDPSARRFVTSLLLADPAGGRRWLIDASPDIKEQTALAEGHPSTRRLPGDRPPLFEGIFLTHAHIGHYAGLIHLGRESYGAKNLPLYTTKSMAKFLSRNGPWSLMVETGAVELRLLHDETKQDLGGGLSVTPLLVPHRDEFSDTCGFILSGPEKSLLYLPDIDKWERWSRSIESVIKSVDYALIDGTFFADGEIPGRAMADIPHPFIEESINRFRTLPAKERAKIYFTHLNHTNPAAIEGGEAQRQIESAGMKVAARRMSFGL